MRSQFITSIVFISAFIVLTLAGVKPVKTQLKQNSLQGCTTVYSFPVGGNLISKESESQINVREEPTVSAKVSDFGNQGEPIYVTQVFENNADGYCWYKVSFQSGAKGWVRGDFVSIFLASLAEAPLCSL
ncbi:SH3 type 3 domain protein [Stanieria cyanosphaera PCC 7437]|uniref:SH3 type 3 domain protein n=1 Tax=Stanieria cyanosphaera (strain ATCC 29371 / PCC 7437) TaxID=111780 RepID=K9XV23_STAC7|nr:SH3 domain-containing protein [Stanieria cyanosphaera]AFZ36393.1 SH3 type 3 domain protein [Stanieria cyanosphaera PCC 7437]